VLRQPEDGLEALLGKWRVEALDVVALTGAADERQSQ
jgi:hypothetical protein